MKPIVEKIIQTLKENQKIAIAVAAMLVLFIYQSISDFFTLRSSKQNNNVVETNVKFDKLSNISTEKATSELSTSQEQQALLVSEEMEIKNKKQNDPEETYNRKKYNMGEKVYETVEYPDAVDEKKIEKNVSKDGLKISSEKKIIEPIVDNKIKNIEEIKEESKLDALEVKNKNKAKTILPEAEVAKTIEENNTPNKKTVKNKDSKDEEIDSIYDLSYKKQKITSEQEYEKNLDLILTSIPKYENTGSSHTVNDPNEGKDNGDGLGTPTPEKPKIDIKPGSSYIAKLMTPLNNLYANEIKPILDIQSGDLQGYRAVGEITFKEATEGIIIQVMTLVDKNNVRYDVKGFAVRYDGDEMTPTFADEIDRHLVGRIGFGALAALSNDYAGSISTNINNGIDRQAVGDNTKASGGQVMADTFGELASQYKTEVKVNPKMMYLMFY